MALGGITPDAEIGTGCLLHFWRQLIMGDYNTYFPSEAYHVERMMHVIFSANYQMNSYMGSTFAFHRKLDECEANKVAVSKEKSTLSRLCSRLRAGLKVRFNNMLNNMMIKWRRINHSIMGM